MAHQDYFDKNIELLGNLITHNGNMELVRDEITNLKKDAEKFVAAEEKKSQALREQLDKAIEVINEQKKLLNEQAQAITDMQGPNSRDELQKNLIAQQKDIIAYQQKLIAKQEMIIKSMMRKKE
jgi:cbb3-type cytochrome oxidase cytochrome c subunit